MDGERAIISAYWEYYRRSTSTLRVERLAADELRWATDAVNSRVAESDVQAVLFLVATADAAPDDQALAYLGAGPIESLLVIGVGDHVIDEVEAWARRNERFRTALRCAWFDAHLPETQARRLRAFGTPP